MKVAESEEDFERAAPRPEPAVPTAATDRRFRKLALFAALLAAFCIGASTYFLFSPRVSGTKPPVNVWMGAGAAVWLGLSWLVVAKLAPKLGYAKPGQGRWARACGYAGLALVAVYGAFALHRLPGLESKWDVALWSKEILGRTFTLRPVLFPAVGFFLASMIGYHLFVNRPAAAEFLVETQGEMKRVSWPTRREWVGSTIVVIVLVFILSMYLFGVDWVLSQLMQKLRIGF